MTETLPEGTDHIVEGAGAGAANGSADASADASAEGGADGTFFERIEALRTQGYDKARDYAEQGRDKAAGALDDLLKTINDAAGQIDNKLGEQYGDYARKAADGLGNFNEAMKGKDIDELFSDARNLIAKAPAVAVGTAAVLGFVIARLAKAGLDSRDAAKPADKA
jgi:ElaB/YqjD/DUF883 family membrane-anchored ribosome-binding protein